MSSKRPHALERIFALASTWRAQRDRTRLARWTDTRRRRRKLAASVQNLEHRNLLTFAIDLFADINTFGVSSFPDEMVQVGDETFFVADNGVDGSELWKTDGTESGTVQIKDILPGAGASSPSHLTVMGDEVFFIALDANDETDLWKSDGTAAGTVEVFDADANSAYYLTDLTHSGGKLFFTAYEPNSGYELWTSDGTSAGTQLVLDINPDDSVIDRPLELTDVGGTLFFTTYDSGYFNRELWKSDGTAAGTMMVADLGIDIGDPGDPTDDDPSVSSNPSGLTNIGGTLYFTAEDFDLGIELFKSDGTEAGTMMVSDLNPSGSSYPLEITEFNNLVYFTAEAGAGGRELYSTNGTTVTPIAGTAVPGSPSNPSNLEVVGNDLFFAAEGSIPAETVTALFPALTADNSFRSGGFAGVVTSVSSTYQGVIGTFASSGTFSAEDQDGSNDGPGWVGAGARIGQERNGNPVPLRTIAVNDVYLEDIDAGDLTTHQWDWTVTDPAGLTDIDFSGFASGNEFDGATEGLLFTLILNGVETNITDEVVGDDLDNWFATRTADNIDITHPGGTFNGDLVTSATVRMSWRPINGDPNNVDYLNNGNEAIVLNAVLTANRAPTTAVRLDAGRELHMTDGNSDPTMVLDIVSDGSSAPGELTASGGKLFFSADVPTGAGRELWVSDGTQGGTMMLVDSRPGSDASGVALDGNPLGLFDMNGTLLFTTVDSSTDRELWSSNGTVAGTALLKNVNPATQDAGVSQLTPVGSDIYFVADDGINGQALWKADTNNGTVAIEEDITGSNMDEVSGVTAFGSEVVFFNNLAGINGEVYRTNQLGDPILLFDRPPIPFNSDGDLFVVAAGRIFFVADDPTFGVELWSSDGFSAATRVTDLNPNAADSNPADLVAFDNQVYFVATDDQLGREIFFSDGFFTQNVADIDPGTDNSDPDQLTVSGGRLYFTANDGSNGRELWQTQSFGAPSLVSNIRSGGNSSNPNNLTDAGGTLYFSADNGTDGFEPYRSQGTAGTTLALGNLNTGNSSSQPNGFMEHNGRVYFSAESENEGRELWSTDGTAAGTSLVADLQPGTGSSNPVPRLDTGQRLLFTASSTDSTDNELWATDGTLAKTILIEDLAPSVDASSNVVEVLAVGETIYFSGTNSLSGQELFEMNANAPVVAEIALGEINPATINPQRSMVDRVSFLFDSVVEIPANAFTLLNRTTNTAVTSLVVNQTVQNNQTLVEITFDDGPSVVPRDAAGTSGLLNSLNDGYYQLTVNASGIESIESGVAMASNFEFGAVEADQFYRWYGDINGDRRTDALDFTGFLATFNQAQPSALYNPFYDQNGDGVVDALDFTTFLSKFLTVITF